MKTKKFFAILLCFGMICTMSPVLAATDSAANNSAEISDASVSQTTAGHENVNSNGPTITIEDGDYVDISYHDGKYYVWYNDIRDTITYTDSPTIISNGTVKGDITFHDFRPDEANPHPTVYLNNLNLSNRATSSINIVNSDITLNIQGDCNLCNGSSYVAVMRVDESSTLTISGDGNLNVTSHGYGAAIGADGYQYQGGATYTDNSYQAASGNIIITDDVHVKAENTDKGSAIGGGYVEISRVGPIQCFSQHGGDINNITISGNACVEAQCNNDSAVIGGGAVNKANLVRPGKLGELNILNNAKVSTTTSGSYAAVGNAMSDLNQVGVVNISSTAQLACFSTTPDCNLIPMTFESTNQNVKHVNILQGNFSPDVSFNAGNNYKIVNADTNEYVNDISIPVGARSFFITVPADGNYNIAHTLDWNENNISPADAKNNSVIIETLSKTGSDTVAVESQGISNGTTYTASSLPTFEMNFAGASVNLNLGNVTISQAGDMLNVDQNGTIVSMPTDSQNILISQPSGQNQTTQNTITVKGNVTGQTIIIKDVHMQSSRPIVTEEGADVNFEFIGDNTIIGTDCQQSTDYPAIEVPAGATVTLSGDGSLNATANGYAAAIGTKGYYRDGKDHSDGNKSSGTVQIEDSLNVKAHSAYGAGIGGGAINGSSCEQHAFDNGTVIIKGSAVVEALGSTEGGYSAGIGGGGCYTSTCAAVGGNGGDVQILENAHVTAVCKGSLGAGIGGGGGCGKTADGFGGDGESFKADNSAVVVATGAEYGPGIGGGGAQQKTCCGTHTGNSGSCSILGNSNVTAQSSGKASNFGIGGHTGGWANYNGSYTAPQVDSTATFKI